MTDTANKPAPPADSEAEIWNAIASFEKILEAIPTDRLSLETLADAYEKVGDHTRATDFTLRLANVMVDESDEDGAHDLLRRIRSYDPNDTRVRDTLARIEAMKPEKVMAMVIESDNQAARRPANIASEISMAWSLFQAGKLSQDDYSHVVHDLSENSARTTDNPVSTLHVLHDMHFQGISEITSFIATSCNTPYITLTTFDLQPATTSLLPLDFVIKRGAIPFELMGADILVAVLNPYDSQLIMDVEDLTGKNCHRYLVSPEEFDTALAKIKKAVADALKQD